MAWPYLVGRRHPQCPSDLMSVFLLLVGHRRWPEENHFRLEMLEIEADSSLTDNGSEGQPQSTVEIQTVPGQSKKKRRRKKKQCKLQKTFQAKQDTPQESGMIELLDQSLPSTVTDLESFTEHVKAKFPSSANGVGSDFVDETLNLVSKSPVTVLTPNGTKTVSTLSKAEPVAGLSDIILDNAEDSEVVELLINPDGAVRVDINDRTDKVPPTFYSLLALDSDACEDAQVHDEILEETDGVAVAGENETTFIGDVSEPEPSKNDTCLNYERRDMVGLRQYHEIADGYTGQPDEMLLSTTTDSIAGTDASEVTSEVINMSEEVVRKEELLPTLCSLTKVSSRSCEHISSLCLDTRSISEPVLNQVSISDGERSLNGISATVLITADPNMFMPNQNVVEDSLVELSEEFSERDGSTAALGEDEMDHEVSESHHCAYSAVLEKVAELGPSHCNVGKENIASAEPVYLAATFESVTALDSTTFLESPQPAQSDELLTEVEMLSHLATVEHSCFPDDFEPPSPSTKKDPDAVGNFSESLESSLAMQSEVTSRNLVMQTDAPLGGLDKTALPTVPLMPVSSGTVVEAQEVTVNGVNFPVKLEDLERSVLETSDQVPPNDREKSLFLLTKSKLNSEVIENHFHTDSEICSEAELVINQYSGLQPDTINSETVDVTLTVVPQIPTSAISQQQMLGICQDEAVCQGETSLCVVKTEQIISCDVGLVKWPSSSTEVCSEVGDNCCHVGSESEKVLVPSVSSGEIEQTLSTPSSGKEEFSVENTQETTVGSSILSDDELCEGDELSVSVKIDRVPVNNDIKSWSTLGGEGVVEESEKEMEPASNQLSRPQTATETTEIQNLPLDGPILPEEECNEKTGKLMQALADQILHDDTEVLSSQLPTEVDLAISECDSCVDTDVLSVIEESSDALARCPSFQKASVSRETSELTSNLMLTLTEPIVEVEDSIKSFGAKNNIPAIPHRIPSSIAARTLLALVEDLPEVIENGVIRKFDVKQDSNKAEKDCSEGLKGAATLPSQQGLNSVVSTETTELVPDMKIPPETMAQQEIPVVDAFSGANENHILTDSKLTKVVESVPNQVLNNETKDDTKAAHQVTPALLQRLVNPDGTEKTQEDAFRSMIFKKNDLSEIGSTCPSIAEQLNLYRNAPERVKHILCNSSRNCPLIPSQLIDCPKSQPKVTVLQSPGNQSQCEFLSSSFLPCMDHQPPLNEIAIMERGNRVTPALLKAYIEMVYQTVDPSLCCEHHLAGLFLGDGQGADVTPLLEKIWMSKDNQWFLMERWNSWYLVQVRPIANVIFINPTWRLSSPLKPIIEQAMQTIVLQETTYPLQIVEVEGLAPLPDLVPGAVFLLVDRAVMGTAAGVATNDWLAWTKIRVLNWRSPMEAVQKQMDSALWPVAPWVKSELELLRKAYGSESSTGSVSDSKVSSVEKQSVRCVSLDAGHLKVDKKAQSSVRKPFMWSSETDNRSSAVEAKFKNPVVVRPTVEERCIEKQSVRCVSLDSGHLKVDKKAQSSVRKPFMWSSETDNCSSAVEAKFKNPVVVRPTVEERCIEKQSVRCVSLDAGHLKVDKKAQSSVRKPFMWSSETDNRSSAEEAKFKNPVVVRPTVEERCPRLVPRKLQGAVRKKQDLIVEVRDRSLVQEKSPTRQEPLPEGDAGGPKGQKLYTKWKFKPDLESKNLAKMQYSAAVETMAPVKRERVALSTNTSLLTAREEKPLEARPSRKKWKKPKPKRSPDRTWVTSKCNSSKEVKKPTERIQVLTQVAVSPVKDIATVDVVDAAQKASAPQKEQRGVKCGFPPVDHICSRRIMSSSVVSSDAAGTAANKSRPQRKATFFRRGKKRQPSDTRVLEC